MILEPEWHIASPSQEPSSGGSGAFSRFIDLPSAPPFFSLFQGFVERRPNAVAVEDDVGTLTYSALFGAASRLAQQFAADRHDVGIVAILLPADARYPVALLAALAAGRCCVLLDPSHPDQRNAKIIARTGATLVVTAAEVERPAWSGVRSLVVSRDLDLEPLNGQPPAERFGLDEPALILATSGSTGDPKLIVHSQRTILSRVRQTHEAQRVTPQDRVLTLGAPSSLAGLTGQLFLLSGASVQFLELKQRGLGGLLDILATRPITILRSAPSMLRLLAQSPDTRIAFAKLRAIGTFGEAFTRADAAAILAAMPPGCRLRTSYGSTEANGFAQFVDGTRWHDPIRVASGKPNPDTMVAVIDEAGRSCTAGEVGELWIRSRYNALGEWIDGALAPGRLEPHPSGDGTRLYRTGDLARYDADGAFVVLGRRDRMLKMNGHRVEPSEVEAVLRGFADVKFAEVIVQEQDGKVTLTAFVVPRSRLDTTWVSTLRVRLRAMLPTFMVPSRIVLVESIPLLANGKVDAVALGRMARGENEAVERVA